MCVCLDCLLESSHFLNFEDLSVPLYFYLLSLLSFNFQLLGQLLLLLLEKGNFFFEFRDPFICGFIRFTLEAIDCLEESIRIFDLVFNERP